MLSFMDDLFIQKKHGPVALVNSFFEAGNNEIDILCMGNSHMNRGIDPIMLEAQTGLRTEMLVGGGLEIAHIYYNLRKALETQQPKIVIIETYPLSMRNSINNKANNNIAQTIFGYKTMMKYGAFTYRGMAVGKRGGDIFDRFSIFPFHEDWTEPEKFYRYLESRKQYTSGKEFQQIQRKSPFIPQAQVDVFKTKQFDGEDISLIAQEERYLKKILELSAERNFQIIFLTVPVYEAYYMQVKDGVDRLKTQLTQLAEGYKNVRFFDYNEALGGVDISYLINERTIGKSQHLNYKGILNTTNAMASYITDNYEFDKNLERSSRNSPESFFYSGDFPSEISVDGAILSINNRAAHGEASSDTINLKKGVKKVMIKGWMASPKSSDTISMRRLVLYKDDGFTFISEGEVLPWKNPKIAAAFGNNKQANGYTFNLDRRLLEPGMYQIFHLIETAEGKFGIQKMSATLRID